jgi:hypothetical protein
MIRRIAELLRLKTRRQFRLTFRAIVLTAAAAVGFASAVFLELHAFRSAGLLFVLSLVFTLLELVVADFVAETAYPLKTEKQLALLEDRLGEATVHALTLKLTRIISGFKSCDHSLISGTVNILVELSPSAEDKTRLGLLQLTDYVGPYGGSKGRITTLEKGIVGRCARTAKTEYVNFANIAQYRHRMVQEFGFSATETERHTILAKSYLAHPLVLGPKVIGVLYFFSTEPQVFPHGARESDLDSLGQDVADLLKTVSIV